MNWRVAITMVLLAGAAISGWSLWTKWGDNTPALTEAAGARPDYVLNDFELVALNDQGQESFTLRAPLLTRDPGTEAMEIATPLFLIPPQAGSDGDAWQVRSKTGWISGDGDELRLRGAVKATSEGGNDAPVTITTEQLNVFPEKDLVTSAVAVTINQPGSILRGNGLEVDLASKQYTLKSKVNSRYVP
ncbi:LPS export ABC transporter periplasmic protein LptC [Lysobacter sp. A289]